jgi:transposase
MAYLEHGMWEVLDVLRRVHRGEKRRAIARVTGRDRKTIGRYVRIAVSLGWNPTSPYRKEPDEDLAATVLLRLQPGPRRSASGENERKLLPFLPKIRDWLNPPNIFEKGLTLTKVHVLLGRQGVDVNYAALYRFVVKHLEFGRKPATVRVADVSPGELAEVDFGRLGYLYDAQADKKRLVHALIVTLVHSRHQYVYLTHTQKLDDLISGMEEAWEFFGGVPNRVVLDNLKAAVTKPDRYDPSFQRTFEQYAQHRGFVIDAALSGHAKGKPHVERAVPYVRENFFRGEKFLSLEHARLEAIRWCRTTAGMRIHGTTRKQPLVVFEKTEKDSLKPIGAERFDVPRWGTPKVHPDCHVRFGYALYSVPYAHRGKKTTVWANSRLLRIYVNGQLVKTHPVQPPGGRSTDYHDYPEEKTAYAMRDIHYVISKARERGNSVGEFTQRLLSGTYPWARLRQSQKLMRMGDKYGNKRLEEACKRALAFDLINVNKVENILLKAMESHKLPATQGALRQLPLPRFLRDNKSFQHNIQTKEEEKNGNQAVPKNHTQTPEALRHTGHLAGQSGLCPQSKTQSNGVLGTGTVGRTGTKGTQEPDPTTS